MGYAGSLKYGMEVATNKRCKKSCSINNGCHGYLTLTSFIFGMKRGFLIN